MRQSAIWYDTCPACQGRGAVPCTECNGIGHVDEISHSRSATREYEAAVEHGPSQHATNVTVCTCSGCACETCKGRGTVHCIACRGHGFRNLPVYAGSYY